MALAQHQAGARQAGDGSPQGVAAWRRNLADRHAGINGNGITGSQRPRPLQCATVFITVGIHPVFELRAIDLPPYGVEIACKIGIRSRLRCQHHRMRCSTRYGAAAGATSRACALPADAVSGDFKIRFRLALARWRCQCRPQHDLRSPRGANAGSIVERECLGELPAAIDILHSERCSDAGIAQGAFHGHGERIGGSTATGDPAQ
ncbi:hypothetical protein D3C72_981080 [compost metagenome]